MTRICSFFQPQQRKIIGFLLPLCSDNDNKLIHINAYDT